MTVYCAAKRMQSPQRKPGILAVLTITLVMLSPLRAGIRFSNVTKDTGIDFHHTDGNSGKRYIVETVTAGLALFDYDGDGDIDIYFLNGAPMKGTRVAEAPRNRLYRNEGNWRFTDVTEKSGLGDTGYGLGVAVGDYDNDGDPDVYVNNYGPNVLYQNNGRGVFMDVTATAGVANGNKVGAGASFLDSDGDGDLDLFVANYIDFTYTNHVKRQTRGIPQYGSPLDYPPLPNSLFRNNGNETFTDISEAAGIAQHKGSGMGMVCADYDNDGDTDVYVANDMLGNFLFNNDGTGRFEETGLLAGVAYSFDGIEQSSMGAECADFDNDGWLDFLVTSYSKEMTTLYRNIGEDGFDDVTTRCGVSRGTFNSVTWGNGMVDFDNDGDRDIFITTGHVQDNLEQTEDLLKYKERNVVLSNTGAGTFTNVTQTCGDGLYPVHASRGAGFDDMDNDGDIDVVILNSRDKPTLLRNDSEPRGHYLGIRLQGVQTNRDGIGARVEVSAGDLRLVDEVHSGRGYQSHYGMRLHFGLGPHKKVDLIKVRWIGGGVDVFKDIKVDQIITLTEGTGQKT